MKYKRKFSFLSLIFAGCLSMNAAIAANIAVVGGKPDDDVWSAIKKGVEDARHVVAANGGSVNYLQLQTYDNLGADAASLIRTAIAQNVDGLVVARWVPEAMDEAIKSAIDAGIQVMLYNSGSLEAAQELGALNFVGADLGQGGVAGGEYLGAKGYKKVLCVNTLPGNATLEAYCQGAVDGIGKSGGAGVILPLPASSFGDQTAVSEAIKATLLQDDSIDSVMTIGNVDANAAVVGIAQAGKTQTVKLGALNFVQGMAGRIQDGTQFFAVDLQGYLHAFLAVSLLAAHIDFGADLPVKPLATGPVIIDADNIGSMLVGIEKGVY